MEKYPDKDIVYAGEHWAELPENEHLFVAVDDLNKVKDITHPFFWRYPIATMSEIEGAIKTGVSQILITAPAFHNIQLIKERYPNVRIRVAANQACESLIPNQNGVRGAYIRPEDVSAYEGLVDVIQFSSRDLKSEQVVFDAYKAGIWNGNLALLIENFGAQVDNRIVNSDFVEARKRCGQRCFTGKHCTLCDMTFGLAKATRDYYYHQLLDIKE